MAALIVLQDFEQVSARARVYLARRGNVPSVHLVHFNPRSNKWIIAPFGHRTGYFSLSDQRSEPLRILIASELRWCPFDRH